MSSILARMRTLTPPLTEPTGGDPRGRWHGGVAAQARHLSLPTNRLLTALMKLRPE